MYLAHAIMSTQSPANTGKPSVKLQVHLWHLGRLGQDVKDVHDGFLPKMIHLG
jgi:hypothetical protein